LLHFSVKGQGVNILDFLGHEICVATTQPCHCSIKAAMDSVEMDEHGYVPIKLYLQNEQGADFLCSPQDNNTQLLV
jgi:hypothetical protein